MQIYGLMAGHSTNNDPCEICGQSVGFNWSDLNGEGMCNSCGTPYNLRKTPRKINIKETWVPVLKKYWQETEQYMGLGQIVIERDYPEAITGREAFNSWLDKNPDIIPKD